MKTVVVGGGIGGISSCLLAANRGEDVTLIEHHENLGGCASYFSVNNLNFDVGATTISGVQEDQPLGKIFSLFRESPKLKKVDLGMIIHLSDGRVIRYFSDFEMWMKELSDHFPNLDHRKFWELVNKISKTGWGFLSEVTELNKAPFYPKYYKLVPYLLTSVKHILLYYKLTDKYYLELINGILFISAQAEASQVPFLVGAMGLSYPSDSYIHPEGMYGFINSFQNELLKNNVKIILNNSVKKITKINNFYQLTLNNSEEISAERVILNTPIWNQKQLFSIDLNQKFHQESIERPGYWGAFVIYLSLHGELMNHFYQIHLNNSFVKNYFVSFRENKPGDLIATISTHSEALPWMNLNREEYLIYKRKITNIIMDDFKMRFAQYKIEKNIAGTPLTFQKFTRRYWVGGLPLLYGKNPFRMLNPKTHLNEVYRVGDTLFPGQGIPAVCAGSLNLDKLLRG